MSGLIITEEKTALLATPSNLFATKAAQICEGGVWSVDMTFPRDELDGINCSDDDDDNEEQIKCGNFVSGFAILFGSKFLTDLKILLFEHQLLTRNVIPLNLLQNNLTLTTLTIPLSQDNLPTLVNVIKNNKTLTSLHINASWNSPLLMNALRQNKTLTNFQINGCLPSIFEEVNLFESDKPITRHVPIIKQFIELFEHNRTLHRLHMENDDSFLFDDLTDMNDFVDVVGDFDDDTVNIANIDIMDRDPKEVSTEMKELIQLKQVLKKNPSLTELNIGVENVIPFMEPIFSRNRRQCEMWKGIAVVTAFTRANATSELKTCILDLMPFILSLSL